MELQVLRADPRKTPQAHRAELQRWYSNTGRNRASSADQLLSSAFQQAKDLYASELTQDEQKKVWLHDKNTIQDVAQAIECAKLRYDAKPTSKAHKWTKIMSGKIMHYGQIMDVLAQHHPEYVSLAWGTFKLLFNGVLNHEEHVKELSKTCSAIADLLPKAQLSIILYPTEDMQQAVAQLYASLINFLTRAVKWYKQSRLSHAWASVSRPWSLSLKDHADEIAVSSRRVDELANRACLAEIRDTHLDIHGLRLELSEARTQIDQLVKLAIANQSLQTQVQSDLSEQRETIARLELNQILSLSFMTHLPTSGESLNFCRSVRDRRRHRTNLILPDTGQLQRWADQPRSSFLLIDTHTDFAAKDFLVDLVSLIQQSAFPVVWALRFPGFADKELSSVDVLRMLVIQALQINSGTLTSSAYPISLAQLREASSEEDWISILNRAFSGMRQVYVVIDADLLGHITEYRRYVATKWLEELPLRITSTTVKIFVSTLTVDQAYIASNWDRFGWSRLKVESSEAVGRSKLKRRRTVRTDTRRQQRRRIK